jgi:uncharacterized protein YcbX
VDALVSGLFVYPVKSCRGIALERGVLEARGLRHDRRWMIVDGAGQFVTQRTEPRLAVVDVAITQDALVLSAPHGVDLTVPLTQQEGAVRRLVRIWRDDVEVVDCGDSAAAWVSDWLGSHASLVFMPENVERAVSSKHARPGDVVGFADTFPLLLASVSSLEDVNARLDQPVPMDRFRPNIVVRGSAPWAEDTWRRIRVGDVTLRVAKPCSRCVITTTDQRTAERGIEPLRTLAKFRTRDNEVYFAQNCAPIVTSGREAPDVVVSAHGSPDALGTLAVGDLVTVVETASEEA